MSGFFIQVQEDKQNNNCSYSISSHFKEMSATILPLDHKVMCERFYI